MPDCHPSRSVYFELNVGGLAILGDLESAFRRERSPLAHAKKMHSGMGKIHERNGDSTSAEKGTPVAMAAAKLMGASSETNITANCLCGNSPLGIRTSGGLQRSSSIAELT